MCHCSAWRRTTSLSLLAQSIGRVQSAHCSPGSVGVVSAQWQLGLDACVGELGEAESWFALNPGDRSQRAQLVKCCSNAARACWVKWVSTAVWNTTTVVSAGAWVSSSGRHSVASPGWMCGTGPRTAARAARSSRCARSGWSGQIRVRSHRRSAGSPRLRGWRSTPVRHATRRAPSSGGVRSPRRAQSRTSGEGGRRAGCRCRSRRRIGRGPR